MTTSIMFHHALPVSDLAAARAFYVDLLGCNAGKATDKRINLDFFGHHLVLHLVSPEVAERQRAATHGEQAAWRHFGVMLDWADFDALAERLRDKDASFLVKPKTRHEGEPQEEALMFLLDPSGNGVEFKTFRDLRFAFEHG
jgi:extradiol dioxygenase family protein